MIRHPARVHLYKNAIFELSDKHKIIVFINDKEIVSELLDSYDIDYKILTKQPSKKIEVLMNQFKLEYKLLEHTKKIQPDIMVGGPAVAHISKLRP